MWRKLAGSAALALALAQGPGLRAEPLKPAGARTPPKTARPTAKPAALARAKTTKGEKPGRPVAIAAEQPGGANAPTQPPPGLGSGAPDVATDEVTDDAGGLLPEPAKNAPQILNRGEMLSLARKYSAEIAQALLEGERLREGAIREKDAIKLACIQDRLSNMKLMKRLSDERLAATERPVIRQDELNLRHEFRGVEMAHTRVNELRKELIECVGENLQVEGPTGSNSVDPTSTNAEIPRMDRPTPASPYN